MEIALEPICAAWLGYAVWRDIHHHRIPNWLTVSAAASGVIMAMLARGIAAGAAFSFKGFMAGFLLLLPPFLLGGMGGGDVKLLAALGCWLGAAGVFTVFLYGALFGGILGVVLIWRKTGVVGLRTVFVGIFLDLITFHKPDAETRLTMPYALPIALGFGAFVFLGPIL